ncbi:uncharacterized protein TM35_000231640 [Trypanosoma theileri]|uniref:Uncharacterized protein n=1 Tax=Trypanosoma theileri TaxID=67003 RepID=A0A1X0NRT0_9TRYP|nr:uncharacterized protein TM35_000231640 [Trypanosoma theileri]ORC87193.1 hypothetical protein TM35_000231640 [Trypanosoma theileri]
MFHRPWMRKGKSLCSCAGGVSSYRLFYSGLDESRVQRLKRSSMVFNRPRGRDTLSLAFERRIQILPLFQIGDLYRLPYNKQQQPSVKKKKKNDDNDNDEDNDGSSDRMKKSLQVLVVDLLSLNDVEAPVAYPAAHPSYYTGWKRMEGESVKVQSQEKEEKEKEISSSFVKSDEFGYTLPAENKRHLRQNGDTTLLHGSFLKRCEDINIRFFVSLCINPYLDVERYRREEAQVEMISGYRNILYEAAELPNGPADIICIPALSCDTCGMKFYHEIGKLNQQSLIKGFHRISHVAKELLITNPNFSVEVYVPPLLFSQFTSAFHEEAWGTPESTLNPGRVALYPGLPPPRSLLMFEGWVGKRPELIEAVSTEGKSLMRGVQKTLDGKEIKPQEVLAEIRVFGREREQKEMLEKEQETAVKEGLMREKSDDDYHHEQLHSGINNL